MKKKLIIIIPIVIAVAVFIGVYVYFNLEDEKTSLTVLEKKWISNNSDKKFDFEIVNNIPVYSMDGKGVLFDFIDSFETDTELEFNKISYQKEGNTSTTGLRIRILNNDTNLSDKDLLISEDGYVAISNEKIRYDNVENISDKVIGVFTADVGGLGYYLKTATNITYKTYETMEAMQTDYQNETINLMIIPQMMYLDKILTGHNFVVNYYFTEMSKKYVLTLSDDNNELNNIVKKYFGKWKKNEYVSVYNDEYLDYYVDAKKMNDKTKAEMLSRNYVYGYVENAPYEISTDKTASGIASEYIKRLERLTGMDITYKKYKNIDELKNAIISKEIDIYFNYMDFSPISYQNTLSPFIEEYVVIRNQKNKEHVSTFEELKGKEVNMLSNDVLIKYIQNNAKTNVIEKKKVDALTKDDNLIIVDKEIYNYYKNSKFAKYEVLYSGNISNDYTFTVNATNNQLYDLFNYIIMTNSYKNYRINGLNSLNISLVERTSFQQLYLIVLGIVLLPILITTALYLILKTKKKQKVVKKEDRRKYTDMLTSLKNRNYLNANMPIWEDSKIFPQGIVIIDLNNIKYVNDNYGHEAGDELIVSAASTLVNTQLENSEIIRTDGNEFLVYLVGYTDKQVETYCKKLTKELKDLPHGFGAATGYSIISDDIKTIDDAINEATLEMKTAKESIK